MPQVVVGQVTEQGEWVAATLKDRNELQDIAFGRDEQTARDRCLKRHNDRLDREEAELRAQPGWVPGSGGQM